MKSVLTKKMIFSFNQEQGYNSSSRKATLFNQNDIVFYIFNRKSSFLPQFPKLETSRFSLDFAHMQFMLCAMQQAKLITHMLYT